MSTATAADVCMQSCSTSRVVSGGPKAAAPEPSLGGSTAQARRTRGQQFTLIVSLYGACLLGRGLRVQCCFLVVCRGAGEQPLSK